MKSTATARAANTKPRLKIVEPKAEPRPKSAPSPKTPKAVTPSWAGRVPQIKPGLYNDGLPFHQIEYLCCKMMLRPNHFTSRESLFSFGKVIQTAAKECGVGFSAKGFHATPLKIREVLSTARNTSSGLVAVKSLGSPDSSP